MTGLIRIPAPPGPATRIGLPCTACRRRSVAVLGEHAPVEECVLCGQRRPHRPERTS